MSHRRLVHVSLCICAFAAALVPAACGDQGSSVGHPARSGIRGSVTASPTCPVERPGQVCPPAPVAASVIARTVAGKQAGRTRSDPGDGHFQLLVPPGTYRVTAETGGRPRCPELTVTVRSGSFATADVACDTGIR